MAKPRNIHEVRKFHGLATIYRRFICGFRTVMTHITDYIRKGEFTGLNAASKFFKEIKSRMANAPVRLFQSL